MYPTLVTLPSNALATLSTSSNVSDEIGFSMNMAASGKFLMICSSASLPGLVDPRGSGPNPNTARLDPDKPQFIVGTRSYHVLRLVRALKRIASIVDATIDPGIFVCLLHTGTSALESEGSVGFSEISVDQTDNVQPGIELLLETLGLRKNKVSILG